MKSSISHQKKKKSFSLLSNAILARDKVFLQLVAISISSLLISFIRYALHIALGQPSQQLRDLSGEHED